MSDKDKTPLKPLTSKSWQDREYRFKPQLKKGAKLVTGRAEKRAAQTFLRTINTLCSSSLSSRGRHRNGTTSRGSYTQNAAALAQRVVVKTRLVKGAALKSIKAHVGYITRPGVEREEREKVEIYSAEDPEMTKRGITAWAAETAKDRHQFWLIVSPENSGNLDLKEYTAELVQQMEKDLGTKLDWVAVNHYNTDTPHVHLMIRGKDEEGKDLVIGRDYIANGIRNRAREIATSRLGYRTELEIRAGISADVTKERLTQIDRELLALQRKDPEQNIDLRAPRHRQETSFALFKRSVRLQRVRELEKLELARETSPGVWVLKEETEQVLRDLGERNDIIKTMHKSLSRYPQQERVIFDPDSPQQQTVTGLVVEKGLKNELYDEKYLIVAGRDRRAYYVPLSRYSEMSGEEVDRGEQVRVTIQREGEGLRKADLNIIEAAQQNEGIYDSDRHKKTVNRHRLPEGVTPEEYVENHSRRIEALEKKGLVQRIGEKSWRVPPDLEQRLNELARQQQARNKVLVKKIGIERKTGRDLEP